MLRNNADARRCSYFKLGLPVVCPVTLLFSVLLQFVNNLFVLIQYRNNLVKFTSVPHFCMVLLNLSVFLWFCNLKTEVKVFPLLLSFNHFSTRMTHNLVYSMTLSINNYSLCQRAYVEILSTREVWRARKRRKSCTRLRLVQLIKAINASVNLKFYYCRARSKQ